MATIISPLLNAVEEVRVYGDLGERKTSKQRRGPPLGHCEACRKPIWRREYVEREGGSLGEKCGGRIGKPRDAARPVIARRPDGELPGQGELFVIVRVKG